MKIATKIQTMTKPTDEMIKNIAACVPVFISQLYSIFESALGVF